MFFTNLIISLLIGKHLKIEFTKRNSFSKDLKNASIYILIISKLSMGQPQVATASPTAIYIIIMMVFLIMKHTPIPTHI